MGGNEIRTIMDVNGERGCIGEGGGRFVEGGIDA